MRMSAASSGWLYGPPRHLRWRLCKETHKWLSHTSKARSLTSRSLSLCFALLLWRRLHGISQQQEKKGSVTPDGRKTPHVKKSNCVRIVFSSIVVVLMDTMWKIGCERNENCSKKRGENVAVMSPSALSVAGRRVPGCDSAY